MNISVRKYVLALLYLLPFGVIHSQICLGTDTTICGNQSVTINNCNSSGVPSNIQSITLNNPTTLSLTDDVYSGLVNIGFTFNFFGTNYTRCAIGSNGIISFYANNGGAYCAYSLTGVSFPYTSQTTRASFMGCYQDINPAITNAMTPQVQYQTIGTAPNRKFVVLYKNIYFFSCTTVCNYYAMILYEGTNELEAHIGNKPVCTSFNGGLAAQGVQNANGTTAFMTPGRNVTQWTANQDSRRFSPASLTNTNSYTITQIPYTYVTSTGNNLAWFSTNNNSQQYAAYNNGSLNINASSLPAGTTGFYLQGNACGAGLGSVSDTTWITKSNTSVTITTTTDTCSLGLGSATAVPNPQGPSYNYSYAWTPGNYTTQTISNVVAGTYNVSVTDNFGCTATASATIASVQPTYSSSSTPVSCQGGNDGTATVIPSATLAGTTYNWYQVGQTAATATGLSQGTYYCIVSTSGGCVDTITVDVMTITPMNISLVSSTDVNCHGKNTGIATVSVTDGTAPYSYHWLNSNSTSTTASDLYTGLNKVVITDAKNCIDTFNVSLNEPIALSVASITPDSTICPEDSIYLTGLGAGGSTAYIYDWFVINNYSLTPVISNSQVAGVDPNTSGTRYVLRVSEVCGSTPAYDTVTISFPQQIVPVLLTDKHEDCQPGLFTFSNDTSAINNQIVSLYINFGNGTDTIVGNTFNFSKIFTVPNSYTIDLMAESVYGCKYINTLKDFVRVAKKPTAGFATSGNPVTIFNTEIQFTETSSDDVSEWEWYAPGSSTVFSYERNPKFRFPEGIEGDYPVQLIVITDLGCRDTTESVIHVVNDVTFYAPNAFTPDGDEHNNQFVFYIDGIDKTSFQMLIFNRWGETVWENYDPDVFWDGTYNGTLCPAGTYTYIVRAKDILTDDVRTFKGFVTILR
ncbi:MAG: hypothetical protein BGO87_09640 [Flavobacteriia bacterium 40-80]|nr:MAG: hypothetical protein BGO87_09640 [Flavobacteriia bacterium 40-80]